MIGKIEGTTEIHQRYVTHQVADPKITHLKFNKELTAFKSSLDAQRKRGVFLLDDSFPEVLLLFAAPQVAPPSIVFGAKLDFTNYDASPISVTLVNPFTSEPYKYSEAATKLNKKLQLASGQLTVQQLIQGYSDDEDPFFCIPGVREYHQHPRHTGNSWYLHRGNNGEGTMGFLVEQLYTFGVQGISGFNFSLHTRINGFNIDFNKVSE